MLDIQFIRDNAELVKEKSKQKQETVDIDKLLVLDGRRRELLSKTEGLRKQRNELADKFKASKPSPEEVERGKQLKENLSKLESELDPVDAEFNRLLRAVPNIPLDDVPVGESEDDNIVAKTVGEPIKFDFEPKNHAEIAITKGWLDKERAAKVTGARFAYLKGDLVKLQFAVIQFVIETLTNEQTIKTIIQEAELKNVSSKPFIPVLPPAMVRTEVYDAMDRLEPREERYKVGSNEDNLWLQGSAEHTMGPMHMGELLPLQDLPIRYLGYATSFRREAGTYGKDTEGIIRMHQFDKLEMESFVNPQGGMLEHLFLVAVQEYLMRKLKLPYRVLQKCTADIGKPNARGIDIEVWLPGQGKYLETHTADFMTDYQARRLGIKVKHIPPPGQIVEYNTNNPPTDFAHTNDATAFALGRTMVGIIENYQTKDGDVKVPDVLKPYIGNKQLI